MQVNPYGDIISQIKARTQPNKYTESWAKYTESLKPKATDSKQFLGSDFDYIKGILKKSVEGDNPIFDKIFGNASRKIGASTDRNVQDIKEQGAQSGFRGASGNLINDAYQNEQGALSGVSDNLALQEESYIQNALAQLLGLNQFEGNTKFGVFGSDRQNSQFQQNFAEQRRQFDEQLAFEKDKSKTGFFDVLGGVLGAGAGALGGGYLGGLGSKWAG